MLTRVAETRRKRSKAFSKHQTHNLNENIFSFFCKLISGEKIPLLVDHCPILNAQHQSARQTFPFRSSRHRLQTICRWRRQILGNFHYSRFFHFLVTNKSHLPIEHICLLYIFQACNESMFLHHRQHVSTRFLFSFASAFQYSIAVKCVKEKSI